MCLLIMSVVCIGGGMVVNEFVKLWSRRSGHTKGSNDYRYYNQKAVGEQGFTKSQRTESDDYVDKYHHDYVHKYHHDFVDKYHGRDSGKHRGGYVDKYHGRDSGKHRGGNRGKHHRDDEESDDR
eukprot:720757_1